MAIASAARRRHEHAFHQRPKSAGALRFARSARGARSTAPRWRRSRRRRAPAASALLHGGGRRNGRRGECEHRDASARLGELCARNPRMRPRATRSRASRRLRARRAREIEIFFASWMCVHFVDAAGMQSPLQCFDRRAQPRLHRAERIARALRRFRCASILRNTPARRPRAVPPEDSPARPSRGRATASACRAFEIERQTTVFSCSSSPAAGLCRRSREIARLRAITRSHAGQRSARRRRIATGVRQSWKKISCRISSAAWVSRKIRFRTDESIPA